MKRYYVLKETRVITSRDNKITYQVPGGTIFDMGKDHAKHAETDYIDMWYQGHAMSVPLEYLQNMDNLELLKYMGDHQEAGGWHRNNDLKPKPGKEDQE
jgi:hypothetical protein